MKTRLEQLGEVLIVIIIVALLCIVFSYPPIEQSLQYHDFIDSKKHFDISNFWNVVSNVPFFIVGLLGLMKLNLFTKLHIQYSILFIGILLVSIGSSYYHLNPNNDTLVWDRLPMTVAFMALFSILISENVNDKIGRKILLPLLVLGLASVIYWLLKNDLRPYVLIQFCPIIIMPIILVCFESKYSSVSGYWFLLLAYIVAKLLEYFDAQAYAIFKISGHSLKHIISAIGLFALYVYYKNRIPREEKNSALKKKNSVKTI
ncbi:MAG: ceramidase domain-containing protein [Psychroserpens sp.]|uniref:ceramidase domain-containing protein n=1 Tax=Psychroserpens sp. TaxID=2020870 RepID=UPI0030022261